MMLAIDRLKRLSSGERHRPLLVDGKVACLELLEPPPPAPPMTGRWSGSEMAALPAHVYDGAQDDVRTMTTSSEDNISTGTCSIGKIHGTGGTNSKSDGVSVISLPREDAVPCQHNCTGGTSTGVQADVVAIQVRRHLRSSSSCNREKMPANQAMCQSFQGNSAPVNDVFLSNLGSRSFTAGVADKHQPSARVKAVSEADVCLPHCHILNTSTASLKSGVNNHNNNMAPVRPATEEHACNIPRISSPQKSVKPTIKPKPTALLVNPPSISMYLISATDVPVSAQATPQGGKRMPPAPPQRTDSICNETTCQSAPSSPNKSLAALSYQNLGFIASDSLTAPYISHKIISGQNSCVVAPVSPNNTGPISPNKSFTAPNSPSKSFVGPNSPNRSFCGQNSPNNSFTAPNCPHKAFVAPNSPSKITAAPNLITVSASIHPQPPSCSNTKQPTQPLPAPLKPQPPPPVMQKPLSPAMTNKLQHHHHQPHQQQQMNLPKPAIPQKPLSPRSAAQKAVIFPTVQPLLHSHPAAQGIQQQQQQAISLPQAAGQPQSSLPVKSQILASSPASHQLAHQTSLHQQNDLVDRPHKQTHLRDAPQKPKNNRQPSKAQATVLPTQHISSHMTSSSSGQGQQSQVQAFANCVRSLSEKFGKNVEQDDAFPDNMSMDSDDFPPPLPPAAMDIITPKILNYGIPSSRDRGKPGHSRLHQHDNTHTPKQDNLHRHYDNPHTHHDNPHAHHQSPQSHHQSPHTHQQSNTKQPHSNYASPRTEAKLPPQTQLVRPPGLQLHTTETAPSQTHFVRPPGPQMQTTETAPSQRHFIRPPGPQMQTTETAPSQTHFVRPPGPQMQTTETATSMQQLHTHSSNNTSPAGDCDPTLDPDSLNTISQDKRSESTTSFKSSTSSSSLDSNTLPFANENIGTIKQRIVKPELCPSPHMDNGCGNLCHGPHKPDVNPTSVLGYSDSMSSCSSFTSSSSLVDSYSSPASSTTTSSSSLAAVYSHNNDAAMTGLSKKLVTCSNIDSKQQNHGQFGPTLSSGVLQPPVTNKKPALKPKPAKPATKPPPASPQLQPLTEAPAAEPRVVGNVLSDIDDMLQGLTDELDAMLEQ